MKKKRNIIPNKASLRYILNKFDDMGWQGVFESKEWKIANGGYDKWFEIYYDNQPIADCIAGKVSTWGMGDINNDIKDYIIDVFPHLKRAIV